MIVRLSEIDNLGNLKSYRSHIHTIVSVSASICFSQVPSGGTGVVFGNKGIFVTGWLRSSKRHEVGF